MIEAIAIPPYAWPMGSILPQGAEIIVADEPALANFLSLDFLIGEHAV